MVAVNTDYAKTRVDTNHTKEMLETISKIGFTHIHWVHQWDGTDLYSVSEMRQIKGWLKELNLKVKGVHASDGTITGTFDDRKIFISPNEFNREAGVELVKNRIDLASFLGAGEIVLHVKMLHLIQPDIGYKSYSDTYWGQLFKSFDSIVKYGQEKKIKIAIENLEFPSLEVQFDQFDRLFKRYSVEELSFCFDLGHNMILSKDRPFAFLERYNERLTNLHLNCGVFNESNETDYKQILKFDTHSIPDKNLVDFESLSKLIAESPYELPVTFEISIPGNIKKGLSETLEAGNEIEALIKKYRDAE
jgi:sugar phosphate isomerase/epimerase